MLLFVTPALTVLSSIAELISVFSWRTSVMGPQNTFVSYPFLPWPSPCCPSCFFIIRIDVCLPHNIQLYFLIWFSCKLYAVPPKPFKNPSCDSCRLGWLGNALPRRACFLSINLEVLSCTSENLRNFQARSAQPRHLKKKKKDCPQSRLLSPRSCWKLLWTWNCCVCGWKSYLLFLV